MLSIDTGSPKMRFAAGMGRPRHGRMGAGGSPCPPSPSATTCPPPRCAAWLGKSRTAAPPCGCWRSPTRLTASPAPKPPGSPGRGARRSATRCCATTPKGRVASARPAPLGPAGSAHPRAAGRARGLGAARPEPGAGRGERLVDACAHAEQAYGVRYSGWGMSRLLRRLGLSRQKARPWHPQGSAAERSRAPLSTVRNRSLGRSRRSRPGRAGAALAPG